MLTARRFFAAGLITVLVGGFAMAQSQKAPPQTPQVPTEQNSNGATKGDPQSNQQTTPSEHVAPISQQHPSDNADRQADGDAHKRAEEAREYWPFLVFGARLKITDSLLALFTFLLIVVGGIQGFFLYRTDQGTHESARAAKINADILLRTQRAHLHVDGFETFVLNPVNKGLVGFNIRARWKNVGLSPATNVGIVIARALVESGNEPIITIDKDEEQKKSSTIGVGGGSHTGTVGISVADATRAWKKEIKVLIYTKASYRDILTDETHTTEDCVEAFFAANPLALAEQGDDSRTLVLELRGFSGYRVVAE